ncbi:MAG: hypothetical protein HYW49_09375 [Deltaproteobacteria bacterium]|nr:hypothetical protein [Deltaproteobacteria bacterium]
MVLSAAVVLVFALVISSGARAGLPSQDPNVSNLRGMFQQGRTPALQDILLGKEWNCSESFAVKNDFRVLEHPQFLIFQEMGLPDYVSNTGKNKISMFAFRPEGLAGAYREYTGGTRMHYFLYLRMMENGGILAEWSVLGASLSLPVRQSMIQALANAEYRAISYLTCLRPLNDRSSINALR